MEQELESKYKERLHEIEERIRDLQEHQRMWVKAGGVGGNMAMRANKEIRELEEERDRILSGKQQEIDKIEDTKSVLKLLKKRIKSHKRKKEYNQVIEETEEELNRLKM